MRAQPAGLFERDAMTLYALCHRWICPPPKPAPPSVEQQILSTVTQIITEIKKMSAEVAALTAALADLSTALTNYTSAVDALLATIDTGDAAAIKAAADNVTAMKALLVTEQAKLPAPPAGT